MQGILNFLAHIPAKEQFLAAAILIFVFWILSKYLFQNEPILRLVVHLWPKSARAHFSLGYFLHRKSKSLEEAEKEIRIAIELKPKFRDAYVILLPLSVANGDENVGQEKYEKLFQQMVELFPNDGISHMLLGRILQRTGRLVEAEAVFRKSLELKPWLIPVHIWLGTMLLEEGRLPEAEDIFRNALYHEPGNADIHYCLATDLATQNRYAEAEAECRRVLAIQPCYSKAYQQLAWCFDAQKRYDDAEKLLRQGIKRCPKDAALYNWLGYILSELNNSSTGKLDDKQDKEIETAFRQAMAIDPHDLYAYFHLGDFLQKRGRYTEAEETYRQIIIKDPNSAAAYSSLGLLLHEKLERYPEAEEAYRQAINKDSNCAIAYYNLGLLFHEKLDRYAEAEEAYRQAIAKAPNDVAAYYNLSRRVKITSVFSMSSAT
jgi:tetratricopeptide (TPR) repeat protein